MGCGCRADMGLGELASRLDVLTESGAAVVDGKPDPCDYLMKLLDQIDGQRQAVKRMRQEAATVLRKSGIECEYAMMFLALLADHDRELAEVQVGTRNRFRDSWRRHRSGEPPR